MQRLLTDLYQRIQALYNLTRRGESIYELLATMYREPLLAAEKQADPEDADGLRLHRLFTDR